MQNASNPATDPQPLFSSSVTASIKGQIETLTDILDSWRIPILILLSVLYFWTTAFRAETKLYWFDEICTVQVSTLRGLRPIWTALTHGADYNPPLMYLLTGFSQHLLGNTSLAARMPEIIAFWIFCLSAYVFTYRFAGAPGALTAFLFPLITIAYWYSYEARAYALVLGFTGLAVLCWQQAQASRNRLWWLIGLGFSLGFVLLSHAFGLVVFFPIAIAEIIEIRVTKRFRSGAWIAMACGGSAILASIILLRTLKTEHLSSVGSLGPWIVVSTYLFILAPAAMVLGLAICAILLPWQKILPAQAASLNEIASRNRFIGKITRAECVLLAGFLSLPIISFVVAFVNRAPLYTRYSLAAVLGFACVLGVAAIGRPAFALALPVIIAVQYIYDFGSFINHRRVYDPVTLLQIDASLTQFSKRYEWMSAAGRSDLPIVLVDDLDFSPTIYYAPPGLQKRMIFGWKGNAGYNAQVYSRLIQLAGAAGRVISLDNVVRTYPAFFLFTTSRRSTIRLLQDNDILNELLPTVQTVTLLRAEGDMQLIYVQSKRSH